MPARILLAAFGAALAAPSIACDPEEMNRELTAVCTAALQEVLPVAAALTPDATEAERALIARIAAIAGDACERGDPAIGAAEAARLARLVGRIEGRVGKTEPIWPARQAAHAPAGN